MREGSAQDYGLDSVKHLAFFKEVNNFSIFVQFSLLIHLLMNTFAYSFSKHLMST